MKPNHNPILINNFNKVLNCLVEGKNYELSPPQRPPQLPTLSDEDIKTLYANKDTGEYSNKSRNYKTEDLKIFEDNPKPKNVPLPTIELLDGLNICSIDGSNQKLENPSFFFILARAALVNFKYSAQNIKPYFYSKKLDLSALIWVDGNIFHNSVRIHTDENTKDLQNGDDLYNLIRARKDKPFLFGYNHDLTEKSPSSHALGWAVKLQQVLELIALEEIDTDERVICIKDGPLFSTSCTKDDNIDGLNNTYNLEKWNNKVLIAVAKRISEGRLMLETLVDYPDLREYYFPNQHISKDTLLSIGTDALILPRILAPGQRTPLIKAVSISKKGVVEKAEHLYPLITFYRRKNKPHNIIRLEVPHFMWNFNQKMVEDAITLVAWQHEIGGKAPLVQLEADKQCQLQFEIDILRKQTDAKLFEKQLNIPNYY